MKKNLLIFLICILISGIVSCILGPCGDWDFFAYHYYNGFAAIHNRIGIDIMPADIQSYFNPLLDAINYLLIETLKAKKYLLLFVEGFPWGCLMFALYLVSERLFSKVSDNKWINNLLIFFAVITGATESVVFSEIGQSFNDISTAVMILLSLYFILKFQEEQKNKYMIFSGLLSGIAFGCKLTVGAMALALILTFLIINFRKGFKYNLKYIAIFSLFGLLGFLLIDGYWMYLLYKNFKNPVFPLFNAIFKSDLYTFINYRDMRFESVNKFHFLVFPLIWSNKYGNYVCEFEIFELRHSFAYFALLISSVLFFIKFQTKKVFSQVEKLHVFMIIFVIIAYVLWLCMTPVLRYFTAILSLSGILIVIFFSQLKYLMAHTRISILVLTLMMLMFYYNYTVPDWGRLDRPLEVPPLPLEKNSVVFLYGKPISYIAALPYEDVKFIALSEIADGAEGLKRTENFYKKLDSIIEGKKKYLIIHKGLINSDKNYLEFIKPRYVNSKLRCKTIHDISVNKASHIRASNFYFCEYLD